MIVVWLWVAMSLVATGVTMLLLRRAQGRATVEHSRLKDHPVRMLAETRVWKLWLWLIPFVGGFLLGLLVLVRDWLPFEIPAGVSVAEILALMGVAMVVQLLDAADDQRISWGRGRSKKEPT